MRFVLPLVLFAFAPSAAAQTFFLQSGHLRVDEAHVGDAATTPVTLHGGRGTAADIGFESEALSLRATVDLTEAHLQAGVGANTPLTGSSFAVQMVANAWAPVLAVTPGAVRVALPRGAPSRSALLPRGAAGARGAPTGRPWSIPRGSQPDQAGMHCGRFALSPQPGAAASWALDDTLARRVVATVGGWDTVEVGLGGFVVVGYRRHDAPCGPSGPRNGFGIDGGSGAGDGIGRGRVVILPAETALYATATSPTPFATLHLFAYGITSRERGPVLPAGMSSWIVPLRDATGEHWLLRGVVRTAPARLVDAPPGHGGFGLVNPWSPDWPTP